VEERENQGGEEEAVPCCRGATPQEKSEKGKGESDEQGSERGDRGGQSKIRSEKDEIRVSYKYINMNK
jgi:hypothetical protein